MLENLTILNESLELRDFHYYATLVAKAYKNAPSMDRSALSHWRALQKAVARQFKMISRGEDEPYNPKRQRYRVVFSSENPYKTAEDMRAQVRKTGDLVIWNGESEHPVMSAEENLKLRAVHDYFAHIAGGAGFGLRGEISAYNRHMNFTPKQAAPALFTEVVGQAAYALVYGSFPKQKIVVLKGFDPFKIGEVSGHSIQSKDLVNDRTGRRYGPEWAEKNFSRNLNRDFALEEMPEEERQVRKPAEEPQQPQPEVSDKEKIIQKVFQPSGAEIHSEAPRTKRIARPT